MCSLPSPHVSTVSCKRDPRSFFRIFLSLVSTFSARLLQYVPCPAVNQSLDYLIQINTEHDSIRNTKAKNYKITIFNNRVDNIKISKSIIITVTHTTTRLRQNQVQQDTKYKRIRNISQFLK